MLIKEEEEAAQKAYLALYRAAAARGLVLDSLRIAFAEKGDASPEIRISSADMKRLGFTSPDRVFSAREAAGLAQSLREESRMDALSKGEA